MASYIAGEMNKNIEHPAVVKMKALNGYNAEAEAKRHFELPLSQRLGIPPDFYHIELTKKVEALVLWTERVGQDRHWDHKPIIRRTIGDVWHKQGNYDYFYDIWSNIHYGYVGRAAGFSESVLMDGAGIEQIISDLVSKAQEMIEKPRQEWERQGPTRAKGVKGFRAWDDAPDRISIGIGGQLFKRYPQGGIEAQVITSEVLAVPIARWMKGVKVHVC